MNGIDIEILTFEQALAELEKIVRALEDGQIGLEESLTHYEKGVMLLKRCYGQLQQAEQKIVLLKGTDANNQPVIETFEPALNQAEATPNRRPAKKENNDHNLF
jgi:exodeoxyribonuclease VII small subunit